MKIAIAGGSGFVGRHLVAALKKRGDEVIEIGHKNNQLLLEPKHQEVEALINLSGSPIFTRWNPSHKQAILRSRVETARALNHFYTESKIKPKVFISASAIGYYGDRQGETLVEESLKGKGFLADVVEAWEKATLNSPIHRVVLFRFGFILGQDGGALKSLQKQVKWNLGAQLGKGNQWISWIHIEDVVTAILTALDRSAMKGVYNLVTEKPVSQKDLIQTLSTLMHKKCFLKVPRCVVKGAFGEASALFLDSLKVYPKKLKQFDFEFRYPDLDAALYSLVRKSP